MFHFGAGTLVGTPIGGNLAANPTPIAFGTLQDVSLDFEFSGKELYGQYQAAIAFAKGKLKIPGKAKYAQINAKQYNDCFFGQTISTGQTLANLDFATAVPASTPWQVTIVAPNSGVFKADLGVRYAATGIPFTQVASAPAVGQYTVSGAGVYTFVTGDANAAILISYTYTLTSGFTTKVNNQLLGYGPEFQLVFNELFQGKQRTITLFRCVATKLSNSTKQEDWLIPEFDFQALATYPGGQIIEISDSE